MPLSCHNAPIELSGQRVLVVGLGKSGVASALFLKARGARVTVSDAKPEAELRQHIPELLDRAYDSAPLEQARALGVPIIGEIELAARFLAGRIIAITGSNGKTTTTALAGAIVQRGGAPTFVGGNIGTPAISLADRATPDTWTVLEVSSFQLETIDQFRPHTAAVLNVTPDHLDRHHTFEAYAATKARIFLNQTTEHFAVLNRDDPTCVAMAERVRSQVHWFSRREAVERGAYIKDGEIVWRAGAEQIVMPVAEVPLKGAHNLENVLAAVAMGVLAGVALEQIRQAVREFRAVEHRLEYVATIRGVEYYNDSKATNVDATMKALESFPANIHIILGGKDKGSDYTTLAPLLRARARRVYTIGAAAEKIEQHLASVPGGAVEVVHASTLENAVRRAHESAAPGDVVLLAPACASFDQFENYEHRGRVFKELVRALAGRRAENEVKGGAA